MWDQSINIGDCHWYPRACIIIGRVAIRVKRWTSVIILVSRLIVVVVVFKIRWRWTWWLICGTTCLGILVWIVIQVEGWWTQHLIFLKADRQYVTLSVTCRYVPTWRLTISMPSNDWPKFLRLWHVQIRYQLTYVVFQMPAPVIASWYLKAGLSTCFWTQFHLGWHCWIPVPEPINVNSAVLPSCKNDMKMTPVKVIIK